MNSRSEIWKQIIGAHTEIHRKILLLYEYGIPDREFIYSTSSKILESINYANSKSENNFVEINGITSLIYAWDSLGKEINRSYNNLSSDLLKKADIVDNIMFVTGQITRVLIYANRYKDNISSFTNEINIPSDFPAPIKTIVKDGKIKLVNPKIHVGTVSDPSVDRLRQAARDILDRATQNLLKNTNADPRLGQSCQALLDELTPSIYDISIEAVGLNWQVVSEIIKTQQNDLPDILVVEIKRVLTTVNVILSQYEEWRIYLLAEAGIKLTPSEIHKLADETVKLAGEFAKVPQVVEPKIVDRLTNMTDAVSSGIVQTEGLGIALAGSVSNLLATLSRVALERLPPSLVDTTLSQTSLLSVPAALSGMVLLTDISIRIIKTFAPTLSQFPPLEWLISVHNEIMKYSSQIKDLVKRP